MCFVVLWGCVIHVVVVQTESNLGIASLDGIIEYFGLIINTINLLLFRHGQDGRKSFFVYIRLVFGGSTYKGGSIRCAHVELILFWCIFLQIALVVFLLFVVAVRMSASHLPTLNPYLGSWLQASKGGKTIRVVVVEGDFLLIGITRNVGVVIIVVARYVPVVDVHLFVWILAVLQTVESLWRTIVNDEAVVACLVGVVQWEHEVSCCFEEVYLVFGFSLCRGTLMHVVGIYISATFSRACAYQVHLYDAVDRTVVDFFIHLLGCLIDDFLYVLNLQGVARCDAHHVLCCTIVTLLEISKVLVLIISVDIALLLILV